MKHSVSKQSTFNSENEEAKSYLDEKGYNLLNKYLRIIGYSGIGEYVYLFRRDFYAVDGPLVYNQSFKAKTWSYEYDKYSGLKYYQFGKRIHRFFERRIEVPFIKLNQNRIYKARTNLDFCVLRSDFYNLLLPTTKLEWARGQFKLFLNKAKPESLFDGHINEVIYLNSLADNLDIFLENREILQQQDQSQYEERNQILNPSLHLELIHQKDKFYLLADLLKKEGIIKNTEIFILAFVTPKQKSFEKVEFYGDHLLLLFIIQLTILRKIIVAKDGNYVLGITLYFRSGKKNCDFSIPNLHALSFNNGLTDFDEEKLQRFMRRRKKEIYSRIKTLLD